MTGQRNVEKNESNLERLHICWWSALAAFGDEPFTQMFGCHGNTRVLIHCCGVG